MSENEGKGEGERERKREALILAAIVILDIQKKSLVTVNTYPN